jgi:hypothetical protein
MRIELNCREPHASPRRRTFTQSEPTCRDSLAGASDHFGDVQVRVGEVKLLHPDNVAR